MDSPTLESSRAVRMAGRAGVVRQLSVEVPGPEMTMPALLVGANLIHVPHYKTLPEPINTTTTVREFSIF